jgi:hypothetical protein
VEYRQSFLGVPDAGWSGCGDSASLLLPFSELVGILESIEPVGEAAKRMSSRKEAFAVWKSLCICAT